MLGRRGKFVLLASAWFVASWADQSIENVADTTCMLQALQKDVAVHSLQAQPSNDGQSKNVSHLDAWDKDYINDGDEGAAAVAAPLTPQELLRLTCGCFIAVLVFLLGVLGCMVAGQKELQQSRMAGHLLNHVVAAIAASLVFTASKQLLTQILTLFIVTYTIGCSIALFAIAFVVAYYWLLRLENLSYDEKDQQQRHMLIVGLVGMYTAAFAAIDSYQLLVAESMYVTSGGAYAFAFLVAVLFVVALVAIVSTLKEVAVYEDQFAAVAVGYCFSQAVEQAIIRSQPVPTTRLDTGVLLVVAVGFIALALLTVAFSKGWSEADTEIGRTSRIFKNMCLMAAAWCVFDAIAWQVSGGAIGQTFSLPPDTETSAFLTALILTSTVLIAFALLCLYSLVFYENPWKDFHIGIFRIIVGAMGFIIGKAWGDYLVLLVSAAGPTFTAEHIAEAVGIAVACLLVTIVVLSLWTCCFLPHSKLPTLSTEMK
jgi:hypothetical protein